jgi:hypothetical protein
MPEFDSDTNNKNNVPIEPFNMPPCPPGEMCIQVCPETDLNRLLEPNRKNNVAVGSLMCRDAKSKLAPNFYLLLKKCITRFIN